MPFNFNSFVSSSGNFNILNLTCEYNYTEKIKNINSISFIINVNNTANLKCDDDSKTFYADDGLVWEIGELNESKTPSLEIKTSNEISDLFPIFVRLRLDYSVAGIKVGKTRGPENEEILLQYKSSCESIKEDLRIVFD